MYAKVQIDKGEKITLNKIKFVRPNNLISPKEANKFINKKAKSLIKKSQPINFKKCLNKKIYRCFKIIKKCPLCGSKKKNKDNQK